MNEKAMSSQQAYRLEEFIKTLGEDELIQLNQLVIERLKFLEKVNYFESMAHYHMGEKVEFIDDAGILHQGKIFKMNIKTVSVRTDKGQIWKVAPQRLRKASGGV
jgi:hypothetical protein